MRFIRITTQLVTMTLVFVGGPLSTQAMTAEQIVRKAVDRNTVGLKAGTAKVSMTMTRPGKSTMTRSLYSESLKDGTKRLLRLVVRAPADQKGVAFLLIADTQATDRQYLYLPAYRKVRRISGRAKRGKFLGSDFSYADLESRDVKDGNYKKLADSTIGGRPAFNVVITPKAELKSEYSKVAMSIDKQTWIPVKSVYYDLAGARLKEMKVKRLKKISGRFYATDVVMKNLKKGSHTRVTLSEIRPGAAVSKSIFSPTSFGK